MSSFAIYIIGFIVLIVGLALAANLVGLSSTWIAIGIVVLLGVAPLFISLNDYVLLVEEEVSAKLREPVKITGLRAGGLPLPHVMVDGISIGKSGIVTAARVTITPDLWSLLGSTKVIHSIRVDRLVLTQKAIQKIPSWTKAASAEAGQRASDVTVRVKSIRLDNAVVMLQKAPFGPFDGHLALNNDNSLDVASITTTDGKLHALIKPERSHYRVDVKATDWKLPVGPALRFDELIVAEESQAVGERLLVDAVGADSGRQAAGDLRDRLRLPGEQPADQRRVEDSEHESGDANRAVVPLFHTDSGI